MNKVLIFIATLLLPIQIFAVDVPTTNRASEPLTLTTVCDRRYSLEPLVDHVEKIKEYSIKLPHEGELIESFTLNSGQKVSITQSNCRSHQIHYTFIIAPVSIAGMIPTAINIFDQLHNI